jgi:multidrug efflux pump subunit AcrA (membrane-fusion protein)
MANVNRQTVAQGAAIVWANAAGGGDSLQAGDEVDLLLWNGDASSKTATLVTTKTVAGLAVADLAVVVAAGEIRRVRLSRDLFADVNGRVAVTYSAVTSVKVALVAF